KCLGRAGDIDRIHDVCDSHADGSRQSAIEAAQKKRRQDTEGVTDVDRCGISARHRDLYLKIRKRNITKSCQKRCMRQFYYCLIPFFHIVSLPFSILIHRSTELSSYKYPVISYLTSPVS